MSERLSWVFPEERMDDKMANSQLDEVALRQVPLSKLDLLARESIQNANDAALDELEKRRVHITLMEFDQKKAEFLDGLGWDELSEHLKGASENSSLRSEVRRRYKRALSLGNGAQPIYAMKIEDFGTTGLSGKEFDNSGESPFSAFVRSLGQSYKKSSESGGRYGVGKAAMRQFSAFSILMVCTRTTECVGGTEYRDRFIGMADLPRHETQQGRKKGYGWFGRPKDDGKGYAPATSVWEDSAVAAAKKCRLDRDSDESGTSILIPGFMFDQIGEGLESGSVDLRQVLKRLSSAIAESFWPLLFYDQMLTASVGLERDYDQVYCHDIDQKDNADIEPFIDLLLATPDTHGQVVEENQVRRTYFPAKVPRKKSERREGDNQTAQAKFSLCLGRGSGDVSSKRAEHVAYYRGAGMVVKYQKITPKWVSSAPPWFAVLQAGNAVEADDTDLHDIDESNQRLLEEFLAVSEPEAHHTWSQDEEGIKPAGPNETDGYFQGGTELLRTLNSDVKAQIEKLAGVQPESGAKGPNDFAQKMGSGIKVGPISKKPFTVSSRTGKFEKGVYTATCKISRGKDEPAVPWEVSVSAYMAGDDTKMTKANRLRIAKIDCAVGNIDLSDVARVRIPQNEREVNIGCEVVLPEDDEAFVSLDRAAVLVNFQPGIIRGDRRA